MSANKNSRTIGQFEELVAGAGRRADVGGEVVAATFATEESRVPPRTGQGLKVPGHGGMPEIG